MIDFLLVSLPIRRFADTFRDHLGVTLLVTCVSAVFALVPFASEEKLLTQGTHDRLVELPLDELVTVHLEHAFLVSVALPERPWVGDDPLEELRGLAATAGAIG